MKIKKIFFATLISIMFFVGIFGTTFVNAETEEEDTVFVYGTRTEIRAIDPLIGSAIGSVGFLFEPLYATDFWDPEYSGACYIHNWLVETETSDESGLHITLDLHDDVTFWNGMPLNASVVKWNWERNWDIGASFYGQTGTTGYSGLIQSIWSSIDSLLQIPGNMKYNDSSQYPELWWNKEGSRYPAEYYDGTNQSDLGTKAWPADIDDWLGRPVWTKEPVYNVYTGTYEMASGNFPGNNRNTIVYNSCTLFPDDPYKMTINLNLPIWDHAKSAMIERMGMMYPTGTYIPEEDYWELDGAAYYDGGKAPANYAGQLANSNFSLMIGTGPFMLTDVDESEGIITMTKNPNYWGGNIAASHRTKAIDPDIDTLIIKAYEDDAAFFTAILDGEIDYWDGTGTWLDYETQLKNSSYVDIYGPMKDQGAAYYSLGLQGTVTPGYNDSQPRPNPNGDTPLDYTLRHAMNFAFNYDHYLTAEVCGAEVIRNKGPFWGALYTDYQSLGLQKTFPRQTENGFFYNLSEARYLLLHNDSLNRAANRGLTDASDNETWRNIAATDPIANITLVDHATLEYMYVNTKSYLADIGIQVTQYGGAPVSQNDFYPYEMISNRYHHSMCQWYFGWSNPTTLDPMKWHMDDILGDVNIFDPNDHTPNWNGGPFLSTYYNVTTEWATAQGYPDWEPVTYQVRNLIQALPFLKTEQDKMLTYGTVCDFILDQALMIWLWEPTVYRGLDPAWTWGESAVGLGVGPAWDFKLIGAGGGQIVIPGFPVDFFMGFTIVALVGLALSIKKKRK
ncbi:MAG: ABC transporter substrate-binding protein [Promethearchaeota archaeon]